jgi:hypothetical protein
VTFEKGARAVVNATLEVVTVLAQAGNSVLVRRTGGQAAYDADQLRPYAPDTCRI